MASYPAEAVVFFIASLFVAAGVGSVAVTHGGSISTAISDDGTAQSQHIATDIEIITDPAGPVYDTERNGNITLHVKNSGATAIEPDAAFVTVLVDDEYVSAVTVTPIDGSTWNENEVVRLEVSVPDLADGDHRVKVIVAGDEAVFRFRSGTGQGNP